mgnify:CR=1 FL=1
MVMGYVLYTSTPQVRFLPPVFDSGIARRGEKQNHDCLSAVFINHGIINMEVMFYGTAFKRFCQSRK